MFKYAAFLSYAHADEAIAARLHKALETYRAPKSLNVDLRTKLKPIFHDAAELTAHHSLSEKIQDAVAHSRFLIVLCSPSAKASHWVNEEIRLFRTIHGESSILCAMADGTPQTSFPLALVEGGREPLAANLSGKENFKLGVTQLAASMLGVGLDELIQRDQQRRKRRSQSITLAALGFSSVMGITAFTAVEARNEAQANRAQAEDLVEYMITDLKEKLEPVGRLDILDSVGDRAVEYYEAQDIEALSDESLARQARARHILGQVALDAGRDDDAVREIMAAHGLTKEVLSRNPEDTDAIFAHAQSEYWAGETYKKKGYYEGVLKHWTHYKLLGQKLYKKDPMNIDWIMEAGYGENNLGTLAMRKEEHQLALMQFKAAIELYEQALDVYPNYSPALKSLANSYAGAAKSAVIVEEVEAALSYRTLQIKIYEDALSRAPNNYNLIYRRANAHAGIIESQLLKPSSDTHMKVVYQALKGFEQIIDHDPQNELWKAEYKIFRDYLKAQGIEENPL